MWALSEALEKRERTLYGTTNAEEIAEVLEVLELLEFARGKCRRIKSGYAACLPHRRGFEPTYCK